MTAMSQEMCGSGCDGDKAVSPIATEPWKHHIFLIVVIALKFSKKNDSETMDDRTGKCRKRV